MKTRGHYKNHYKIKVHHNKSEGPSKCKSKVIIIEIKDHLNGNQGP